MTEYLFCLWRAATDRRSGWGWTQREDKISRKTVEVARSGRRLWVSLTEWKLWFKPWREIMSGQKTDALTSSSHFNTKSLRSTCRGEQELWLCLHKQTIGLANKLVQFKKRPLYSCSLKAAYTKTYEKNLWYKEFQNTKNFTSTFKSILLYIHKRGSKIKMTEKERCSKVVEADLSSWNGGDVMPQIFIWAAPVTAGDVTHSCLHPSLLQPGNTITQFFFNFYNWKP